MEFKSCGDKSFFKSFGEDFYARHKKHLKTKEEMSKKGISETDRCQQKKSALD
jgi:hypothetical protein